MVDHLGQGRVSFIVRNCQYIHEAKDGVTVTYFEHWKRIVAKRALKYERGSLFRCLSPFLSCLSLSPPLAAQYFALLILVVSWHSNALGRKERRVPGVRGGME